jgi:heat shock protein HslJ
MKSVVLCLLVVLLGACATHGGEMNSESYLIRHKWVLSDGLSISLPEDSRPNITFSQDGRVTGFSGCNRFFGGYTVFGSELRFSQLGSTKMACLGEGGEIESRLLSALSMVRTYRAKPDELHLITEQGSELILTPE